MTATIAAPVSRRSVILTRTGLILGGILSALQIQTGLSLWQAEGLSAGTAVLIAVAMVALVAIVFAWRGSFPARLVTIAACLVPALMGLPVYFISDIPAGAVLLVSIGICWALVVAALLLLPGRRPTH
ncbi:MAG: hypothetical protein ABW156_00815 [Jiangellaceae bacterium]